MKITWRIWITALLIQPVLFGPLGLFVIPIEIMWSLPGILIFWVIVSILERVNIQPMYKWILLYLFAAITAALCTYLFLLSDDGKGLVIDDEKWLFMIPAPAAAILAVVIRRKLISKHIIHTGIVSDNHPL